MKHYILVITIILFNCSSPASKVDNQQERGFTKDAINILLDNWHADAAKTNFEPYFSRFSDDGVFIGTDASEIWDVEAFKSFSKPYFDKGEAWSFKATDRNIYFAESTDNVVWFDELLDTWMGTCRGSGVFELKEGEWKLKHYVLSLTVPNEKMDSVIATIKEKP